MVSKKFFYVIVIASMVAIIEGHGSHGPHKKYRHGMMIGKSTNCSEPPSNGNVEECCQIPKENIWGDLMPTINACVVREKMPESSNSMKNRDLPNSPTTTTTTTTTPVPTTTEGKKGSSFHERQNDECFIECVFEKEGLLSNNKINKGAVLNRVSTALKENSVWREVAVAAVEKCHQISMTNVASNSTCQSGAAQMFQCVFKEMFLNCPNWPENNEFCKSVKEFYKKCPNGPPPPIENKNFSTDEKPTTTDDYDYFSETTVTPPTRY